MLATRPAPCQSAKRPRVFPFSGLSGIPAKGPGGRRQFSRLVLTNGGAVIYFNSKAMTKRRASRCKAAPRAEQRSCGRCEQELHFGLRDIHFRADPLNKNSRRVRALPSQGCGLIDPMSDGLCRNKGGTAEVLLSSLDTDRVRARKFFCARNAIGGGFRQSARRARPLMQNLQKPDAKSERKRG